MKSGYPCACSRTPVELALRLVADGSRPPPTLHPCSGVGYSGIHASVRLPLAAPSSRASNNPALTAAS
ncbi:MAG TPA: hypothetical protein GXX19_08625 [Syntrophomonadaceae bacterium]|nr:hypothetical protein [Syntrophomonadaceae bacterium]